MGALYGNAVVGQSGGPTVAINATLAGVILGAMGSENINKLYGMQNGIDGFLQEKLIDLSYMYGDYQALEKLSLTPASALGSCRKKLPDVFSADVYNRIACIFEKYKISYFFYIGGNDSMDTVDKLDRYFKEINRSVKIIGIPKTVDNDLTLTDHTPGYGSASKYIATVVQEISRDILSYNEKSVTIVEIMGRDSGWLTAACGLPSYLDSCGADLIYFPEIPFDDDKFIRDVEEKLEEKPNVLVAVSEGICYKNGVYVSEKSKKKEIDAFGHKYLTGTSAELEKLLKSRIGCKTRAIALDLPQRCASHIASYTDLKESCTLGKFAVNSTKKENISGKMVNFIRVRENYKVIPSYVEASRVANKIKRMPKSFINEKGNYVTDECMEYLYPLIQGEVNTKYNHGIPIHFKITDRRG